MNRSRSTCAFLLSLLMLSTTTAQAGVLSDHSGRWLGAIPLPKDRTLKMGAELFTRADGSAWASVAIPDQGVYDLVVAAVHDTGDAVVLDIPNATLTLRWADAAFAGRFQENGGPALDFILSRVEDFPRRPRAQWPKAPFPYRDESLAIRSSDGVVLGATLSMPKGAKTPNAVVLVHGAGPSTRDEDGTFAVLADHLARQGVAVLRYDKRGVGRSTGDYDQHTQAQLADDVAAALQALRARKQFRRIGVIGHSEGPGVAAAVAARHPGTMDFLVSLAGVGLNGLDMLLLQDRVTAIANGATPDEADRLVAWSRRYYAVILAEADEATRTAALKKLEDERPADDRALAARTHMDEGSLSVERGFAGKPFLRVQLQADTPADWRQVTCPVLALNGSVDRQVPPESMAGIVAALAAGGNRHVESAVLPSLNHLFQTAGTGAEDEYDTIEEVFAPIPLQRIGEFVRRQ